MRSKLIDAVLQFPQFIDRIPIVAGDPGQGRAAQVQRVLRECGKGNKIVLLPPAVGRAIDRAIGGRSAMTGCAKPYDLADMSAWLRRTQVLR